MSTSEPLAPKRLEALLRGEAGLDGRERRIGALLDELTLGEIAPPAELRERVRAFAVAPQEKASARRSRRPRPRPRLVTLLGAAGAAAVALAVVVIAVSHMGTSTTTNDANLKAEPVYAAASPNQARVAVQSGGTANGLKGLAPVPGPVPLPDGQRAQDYAATLQLAVGSIAALSRSTQTVLDTVRALGGAVETVNYATPSAGSGSAAIDLRVPVGRAQEALTRFSSLGTITSQQVQIRDLQSGLDSETNRARALRHRIALLQAKLLSPTLTAVERATLENSLADAQTGLSSVLRGVHATQQRAAFARFSLDLVTGHGVVVTPKPKPQPGPFERTADSAFGVISVAGRAALFAAIVAGPFLLLFCAAWWLTRRLRRRSARRLLESS